MSHDAINNWVANAKSADKAGAANPKAIKVVRATQSKGNLIMEVAEKLRPHLLKLFEGVRDTEGMLLQPARVRGIALNMAQSIVQNEAKG